LLDHLMKVMVYIITTKGYDITSEDNDEVKFTKLTAKIDVRELNYILKTTLRSVETFDNDEVDEEFAEVTLNVWGVLGFERVLVATAKRHVLSSNGNGHAYWDLIAPEGLTGELTLLRGFRYAWNWLALAQQQQQQQRGRLLQSEDAILPFSTLNRSHLFCTQSILVRSAVGHDRGLLRSSTASLSNNNDEQSQRTFSSPKCLSTPYPDLSSVYSNIVFDAEVPW
ncbi:hypothetical protein KCU64_g19, partial [Aureobasidium melanogenum]